MKELNIELPGDTLQAPRVDDVAITDCSDGHSDLAKKPQRRVVPPPTWPKIPEGAAGTAAAFGAWKTVTHSGRKI